MRRAPFCRLMCAGALAVFANCASAQYIWLDAHGAKQVSDRPPPPSIPDKNILKQPRTAPLPAGTVEAPDSSALPTLAERDADFRKRAQEKVERERDAAEQARHKAAQRRHCAMAQAYSAQLQSGQRLKTTGYADMSDAERARQTAQARTALVSCR